MLWARLVGSRDGRERRERAEEAPLSLVPSMFESSGTASGTSACAPGLKPALLTSESVTSFRLQRTGAQAPGPYGLPCECDCRGTFGDRFCMQAEIAACNLAACGAGYGGCRKMGPAFYLCMAARCGQTAFYCAIASGLCYRSKCGY